MKTKLLAVLLLAGSSLFAAPRVFVGIGVGIGGYVGPAYAPPAVRVAVVPPCPGPGYAWVGGYWYRMARATPGAPATGLARHMPMPTG